MTNKSKIIAAIGILDRAQLLGHALRSLRLYLLLANGCFLESQLLAPSPDLSSSHIKFHGSSLASQLW